MWIKVDPMCNIDLVRCGGGGGGVTGSMLAMANGMGDTNLPLMLASEAQAGSNAARTEPAPAAQAGPTQVPDSQVTFTNLDRASAHAAREDEALQQRDGGEYAILVYSSDGKTFKLTEPVTQGMTRTVDPFNTTGGYLPKAVDLAKAPIPPGTELYAETHSHPDNLGLSGEDVQRAHDLTIRFYHHPKFSAEYVGQPSGDVIRYDPKTGKQTTFGPGQP
jgi:hypothetical protein